MKYVALLLQAQMNLYAIATLEHNRRVRRSRVEQFYQCITNLSNEELAVLLKQSPAAELLCGFLLHKQQSFEEREAEWKSKRAAQKKANRKEYRGSWRQRRGHGHGWVVFPAA